MKNSVYEDAKYKFKNMCKEKNISWTDAMIYMIYSEYPIAVIDEKDEDIQDCFAWLESDYNILSDAQPTLEEDEELAFAIQHARDIIDVLLGRDGVM